MRLIPDGKTIYTITVVGALLASTLLGCAPSGDAAGEDERNAARGDAEQPLPAGGTGRAAGAQTVTEARSTGDTLPLHPAFSLTSEELESMTESLPEEIRATILADPDGFLTLAEALLEEPEELLWLVDKGSNLPEEYAPTDLIALEEHGDALTLNREGLSLRRIVMEDLLAMVAAARSEGIALPISSTYRSYDYQERLFAYWVEELGEEEARRSSAEPGTSQHQLGTTIDFGSVTDAFADTDAGRWLAREAWRYGFSLSYPEGMEELTGYKYESWHFRYLGRAATEMERRYFDGVQQLLLEFWAEHRRELSAARRSR